MPCDTFLRGGAAVHRLDRAYPGFCRVKRLGVFLLPPGFDAR